MKSMNRLTAVVRVFKNAGSWAASPTWNEQHLLPVEKPILDDKAVGQDISRTTNAGAAEAEMQTQTNPNLDRNLRQNVNKIPLSEINDLNKRSKLRKSKVAFERFK